MRLLLLAPPGAGKGTQGERLAARLGVRHIAAGDLLRAEVRAGTPRGDQIAEYQARGDLVPDQIVFDVLTPAVVEAAAHGGYILDGFPRTLPQATIAAELGVQLDVTLHATVYLYAPEEVLTRRLLARASQEGRADDTAGVIRHRLEVFAETTEPLVAYYRKRGILVAVDADQPPDSVTAQIQARLSELTPPRNGLRFRHMTAAADWHDFATMIGGASGALTGLLFVAVSLNAGRIAGHAGLRASAAQTLILFLTPLTIAAALLTPHQPDWVLGAELIAIGLVTGTALLANHRVKLGLAAEDLRLISIFNRTPPNVIAMLLVLASGVILAAGESAGLYLLFPATGIVMAVTFVAYQQLENHILNPLIMSKTVKVDPLLVLLAVLFGTSIGAWVGGVFGGFVAALLSIPCAAALQVIIRDIWRATAPGARLGGRSHGQIGGHRGGASWCACRYHRHRSDRTASL